MDSYNYITTVLLLLFLVSEQNWELTNKSLTVTMEYKVVIFCCDKNYATPVLYYNFLNYAMTFESNCFGVE